MRAVNAAGIDLIKGYEQLALSAYVCPAGKLTIGWGHTDGVRAGQKISREMAEEFFMADLSKAGRAVENLVTVPLTDNQFAALTSFVFNLGPAPLAASTLLRLLNAGKYELVAERRGKDSDGCPIYWGQLLRFVWASTKSGRKKLKGLIRRRVAEAALWCAT